MNNLMILCLTFLGRHGPLRRGCAFKHQSRACSGVAHRVAKITDRARAIGVLGAVLYIAQRLLDFHTRPVGVELVCDYRWKPGANSRAHFRAVRDNDHRAVGLDSQIHARLPGSPVGSDCWAGSCESIERQQACAEHQRARRKDASKKSATRYQVDGIHLFTSAACLIA